MIQAEATVEHKVEGDFEAELIDRFFNPRSYFLNRFLDVLREKETENSDPVQMVAVGLIVDQIINAEDKQSVLAELNRFPAFRRYHEQLQNGIQFLKNGRLTTQQMMDVVGALGSSLAEALLEIVQEEEGRNALLEMAGVAPEKPAPAEEESTAETYEPEVEMPEWAVQPEPETVPEVEAAAADEAPWSFFKSDIDEKLHLLEKHLEQFARHPQDWGVFRTIKDDFRDLRDWSMIQGEEGIEAISHKILRLFEAVYARGAEHRARIVPILRDALETMKTVNRAGRGGERLDIVRVMVHQIERQRRLYPERLEEVATADAGSKPERPERPPADSQSGSMPVEAPVQPEVPSPTEVEVEEEAARFLEEQEPITSEAELEESVHSGTGESEIEAAPAADTSSADEVGAIRESELLSELMSEHGDELADLELPELGDLAEELHEPPPAEEIHLPGEDDEELLSILSELKEDGDFGPSDEPAPEADLKISEEASRFDRQLEQLEEAYAKEIENESDKAGEETASSGEEKIVQTQAAEKTAGEAEAAEVPSAGSGQDFVSEADMYFTFGRKALQNLMKNPEDRQALEDLELATYSLKIAERMTYREIARAFGLAEQLVQNRIEMRVGLKPEQVNALVTLVHEVEQAGREQTLTDPARQNWLKKQIEVLSAWVKPEEQQSEPEKDLENGKKSSGSEDPLDFLLFDDTSKFFKNLLSE